MHTILIAHRNIQFAEQLARELRKAGGYRVITCPGPWPPQRCIRCDKAYCPLTEGADLMIYDPQLTSPDDLDNTVNLAAASASAHPEVPMLLAWRPSEPPDIGMLRAIRAEAPHVHVAAHELPALLRQIGALLEDRAPRAEALT
jgi:hypothetical protein